METFSERIKQLRTESGLSQQDLANELGIGRSTLANYEQGNREPNMETMELFADFFNVDMNYLTGFSDIRNLSDLSSTIYVPPELWPNEDEETRIVNYLNFLSASEKDAFNDDIDDNYDNLYKIDKIKLPMLGTIACGEPIFADEDRESYVMVGTEIRADFCLKCQGDSMINARIHDGDIVFIRKQDIVDNGEIAAVIIDDEATLKRFYYYKEQNMVILRPENSKYKDIILTGEQLERVKVLGKAVAFQSDVE